MDSVTFVHWLLEFGILIDSYQSCLVSTICPHSWHDHIKFWNMLSGITVKEANLHTPAHRYSIL